MDYIPITQEFSMLEETTATRKVQENLASGYAMLDKAPAKTRATPKGFLKLCLAEWTKEVATHANELKSSLKEKAPYSQVREKLDNLYQERRAILAPAFTAHVEVLAEKKHVSIPDLRTYLHSDEAGELTRKSARKAER